MKQIKTEQDMVNMVNEWGILPLLENEIPGFSVFDHTHPSVRFQKDVDGPWEWKGPVIQDTGAAYGKFFHNTAGYITFDLYCDFANYRRDGYDIDARYNDKLLKYEDLYLYSLIDKQYSISSTDLKIIGNYGKDGRKGFESHLTRLQMLGYVVVADFEYKFDQNGKRYGWGVARYTTPEKKFGDAFTESVYKCTPEQSKERLWHYLRHQLPKATDAQLRRIIG